jgi:transcriptional regulator with XRE-family HTH domain
MNAPICNPTRKTGAIDHNIGQRIADCRKALGLSRKTLAEKIGSTTQQLHKYETGANRLPVSHLCDIARALNIQAHLLLPQAEGSATAASSLGLVRDFERIGPTHQQAIRQLVAIIAEGPA